MANERKALRMQAERTPLRVMLNNPNHVAEVFSTFPNLSVFSDTFCRKILEAGKALHMEGKTPSMLTLREKLSSNGATPEGLLYQLSQLQLEDCYPSELQGAKRIILDDIFRTKLNTKLRSIHSLDDALEIKGLISDWENAHESSDEPEWRDVVGEAIERQTRIMAGEDVYGFSTGIPALDRHVVLQPSKLYVIGGLKKAGKSLLLLSILEHHLSALPPIHCALFSLEMSRAEIARKLLSRAAGVDSRKIYSRYMNKGEFDAIAYHADTVREFPLLVNDSANLTTSEIYSRALRWKYNQNIPDDRLIVAVDFLQLVNLDMKRGENEASAIGRVAYDLARLAKNLRCVVVALAQLNNSAEGQKPSLRYLEGSGKIAQAAECILLVDLLHRRDESYSGEGSLKSLNVVVSAQRSGESGVTVQCKADLSTGSFTEVSRR